MAGLLDTLLEVRLVLELVFFFSSSIFSDVNDNLTVVSAIFLSLSFFSKSNEPMKGPSTFASLLLSLLLSVLLSIFVSAGDIGFSLSKVIFGEEEEEEEV